MKTLFLILNLLADPDAICNVVHSCFIAALVSVAVFVLLGAYQMLRRLGLRRNINSATPSRA
jgi:hypothetical protein